MKFKESYYSLHYKNSDEINFYGRISYRANVKYLSKLEKGTLLDCGCGLGHFLSFAEKKFATMGFDISDYAISQSKKNAKLSKLWVLSAGEKMPIKTDTVDVVTAFDIVEHFANHTVFFNEVKRVLKPQGVFLIRTPNMDSYALRLKGKSWYGYRDKTHISLEKKEYWVNKLNESGFGVIDYGTDLIWDTPIFSKSTQQIEKFFFKGIKVLFQIFKPFANVAWGDNLIIVSKKL